MTRTALCAVAVLFIFGASAPFPAADYAADEDAATDEDVIVLHGPTLIAFTPSEARRDTQPDRDLSEILADFYYHLESARKSLEAAGVSIHERDAGEIRVRDGGRLRVIGPPPDGKDVGYYMLRPGRDARLVLGVYTDVDLVQAAGRHLGIHDPRAEHDREAEPAKDEIPYTVEDGKLHLFGHSLQPRFPIKVPDSPEDEDRSSISFSPSGDERWIVIKHRRDVNSSEYWLFDSHTKKEPFRIPGGSGRHGGVHWHGNDLFEIRFSGMGYTISRFVEVEAPERIFPVTDLLYCDAAERIYVALVSDGVEIGRLFTEGTGADEGAADEAAKERFPIALEYESPVDALMTIDKVSIEGELLIVVHTRKDGTLAREVFHPRVLQN